MVDGTVLVVARLVDTAVVLVVAVAVVVVVVVVFWTLVVEVATPVAGTGEVEVVVSRVVGPFATVEVVGDPALDGTVERLAAVTGGCEDTKVDGGVDAPAVGEVELVAVELVPGAFVGVELVAVEPGPADVAGPAPAAPWSAGAASSAPPGSEPGVLVPPGDEEVGELPSGPISTGEAPALGTSHAEVGDESPREGNNESRSENAASVHTDIAPIHRTGPAWPTSRRRVRRAPVRSGAPRTLRSEAVGRSSRPPPITTGFRRAMPSLP
ncbi:MAG: hypothetical protein R2715_01475 [Ilumatobacteraceae bacterium]